MKKLIIGVFILITGIIKGQVIDLDASITTNVNVDNVTIKKVSGIISVDTTKVASQYDLRADILELKDDSINAYDTIYLKYIVSPTSYGWLIIDSTNQTLFADTIAGAAFGLTDELLPIDEYLKDLQNGELKYYYAKDKYSYGLKGLKPTQQFTGLMWQNEYLLKYVKKLEMQIKELENK